MTIAISNDKSLIDLEKLHRFLRDDSTWAKGISVDVVAKSLIHSLCFVALKNEEMVGFTRVITDYATFGNLVDVIVWPEYRGQGISKKLMEAVVAHPDLQGLRRFTLATSNAHSLYAQYGFEAIPNPDIFMQRYDSGVYLKD